MEDDDKEVYELCKKKNSELKERVRVVEGLKRVLIRTQREEIERKEKEIKAIKEKSKLEGK